MDDWKNQNVDEDDFIDDDTDDMHVLHPLDVLALRKELDELKLQVEQWRPRELPDTSAHEPNLLFKSNDPDPAASSTIIQRTHANRDPAPTLISNDTDRYESPGIPPS